MLTKLLKYDLKYMIKNMCVFYILSVFFAITSRILFSMNQTIIIDILGKISVGCMFAMVANIIINVMMRSWVRFRDSIYKDEAYLTHTLPVTKNDIYNSKFIQTLIFFFISFIVVIISLFITYYTDERWILLKELVNNITTGLNFSIMFFVICSFMVIFLEMFNIIQCGFLGIILGYKQNNNKIVFSIVFGIIAYFVSQSIVVMSLFIVGLFNNSIMALFNNDVLLDPNTFKLLLILSIATYLLIIIVMNIISKKIFNRGVNIE